MRHQCFAKITIKEKIAFKHGFINTLYGKENKKKKKIFYLWNRNQKDINEEPCEVSRKNRFFFKLVTYIIKKESEFIV